MAIIITKCNGGTNVTTELKKMNNIHI